MCDVKVRMQKCVYLNRDSSSNKIAHVILKHSQFLTKNLTTYQALCHKGLDLEAPQQADGGKQVGVNLHERR